MEYFQLASSDLKISRIGFGCAAISGYDYGKVDERSAIEAIRKSWEKGVNLFDTSDVYGFGYTEKLLAKALGTERHNAIITTKFGVNWDNSGRTYKDCSVKRIVKALENSMRRLKLDCIPIYMVHWHDGLTPFQDLMVALKKCQKDGKIRYIGCSNFTDKMVSKLLEIDKLDFIQQPYNLISKDYERQLYKSYKNKNIGTIIYDVLARGLLSGKYKNDIEFEKNDTRSRHHYFKEPHFSLGLDMVKRLRKISNYYSKSPAQLAIKWALGKSFVNCVLVGSKNVKQVTENIAVFDWELAKEHRASL